MARALRGQELDPVYARYRAMYNRCFDEQHLSYQRYGGRGITISSDLMPFSRYREYVESLPNYDPVNLTLDRIDSNKNYEKGNLRWVCRSTQTANIEKHGKGSNKYTGVNWSVTHNRWIARVNFRGKTLLSKSFLTEIEALEARNQFILENALPHPIQERATTIP